MNGTRISGEGTSSGRCITVQQGGSGRNITDSGHTSRHSPCQFMQCAQKNKWSVAMNQKAIQAFQDKNNGKCKAVVKRSLELWKQMIVF